MQSPVINELIDAFKQLPTIGQKSAQRLTYYLLQDHQTMGHRLASAIDNALAKVGRCQSCRNLSESDLCPICAAPKRARQQLCIVESPTDILAIEQSGVYHGLYFVLMGHLSPIDGIGPEQLGLPELKERLQAGEVEELIIATNPTVEGEATAHYIQQMASQQDIQVTRLAQGIPLGGELEYIDAGTLGQAFVGRKRIEGQ